LLFSGSLHSGNYQCKVYRLGQAIKHETKCTERVGTYAPPLRYQPLLPGGWKSSSQPGRPLRRMSFDLESSASGPGSVLSCSEVVEQASTPLSWFCWCSRSCPRSVAYASWTSFLGCFVFVVAVNDGDNPVILVLCSCFERGSRWGGLPTFVEVDLADVLIDFGVRGGFRGCWCPFAFPFVSVGHRRTGGGHSRRSEPWALTHLGDVIVAGWSTMVRVKGGMCDS
jgi:hypothetical protein